MKLSVLLSLILCTNCLCAEPSVVDHALNRLHHNGSTKQEILAAVVSLAELGPDAKATLPDLRKLSQNRDRSLVERAHAVWAMEQIEPSIASPAEYHVATEASSASDDGDGSANRPWKTIHRAAEAAKPGDTVIIHGGVYREMVRPFLGGTGPERMITYKAAPDERPIIKGSDIWKAEWKDEGEGIWSTSYERHPWDHPEKWKTPFTTARYRCEQIFVDGAFLTHVDSRAALGKPGTFLTIDDGCSGRLFIHPEGDRSPAERVVERSMRQHCFYPAVKGLAYIHLQGLTFQHSAGPEFGRDWGSIGTRPVVSVRYGNNWLIEDNVIEWGNAQGLDVGAWSWGDDGSDEPIVGKIFGYHTVRRNRANHNGVSGIAGTDGIEHILFEDNETSFNGHKADFWHYESAGLKVHNAKNCTVRRHVSRGNGGFGIWFDWGCLNNRITQSILVNNVGGGFFIEASAGPNLIDCNVVTGTREAPPPETPNYKWADGIYGHDSNRTIVMFNYIEGCQGYGVRLRNLFGRIGPGDKPTTNSHNRVLNNFLVNNERGAVCFNPEVSLAHDNRSDYNVLWSRSGTIQFQLENGGSGVDWSATEIGKVRNLSGNMDANVTLPMWRNVLHQDVNSELVKRQFPFRGLSAEEIRERLISLAGDLPMPESQDSIRPVPTSRLLELIQDQ